MSTLAAILTSKRSKARNRAAGLVAVLISSVDSRLLGKSSASARSLFTGYNTTTPASTRSPSVWCGDVDLTPISSWNSHGKNLYGGVLIAPDVLLYANHATHPDGTVFDFVKMDNTRVQRTQTAHLQIGYTDIGLAKLSSEVGAGITPAKIFSAVDFAGLASFIAEGSARIPMMGSDQQEKALVFDTASLAEVVSIATPLAAKRAEFNQSLIVGDSGSPVFWIFGNQLVIAATWQTSAWGASVHAYRADVNAGMVNLGSTHQLTELNF